MLAPEDIERLCLHLGLSREDFLAEATMAAGGKIRLKSRPDGYCVYFVAGHGCGVHEARPDICRAWPFFRGNLIDAISWEMAQDFCPGINGSVPHAEFVRQGLDYLRAHGICRTSGPLVPGREGQDKVRDANTPEALVMERTGEPPASPVSQGTASHED